MSWYWIGDLAGFEGIFSLNKLETESSNRIHGPFNTMKLAHQDCIAFYDWRLIQVSHRMKDVRSFKPHRHTRQLSQIELEPVLIMPEIEPLHGRKF